MTAVLEARGLSKTYTSRFPRRESFTALSDVSFEVRRGEILAFLGPNGAGKTTGINLLLGFLRPTSGEGRLFGLDPNNPRARSRLGYLPENYAFYSAFTGPAVLNYFGRLCGIARPERKQRIDELMERVGLAEARRRPVGKYSRGMRQRLGIAQALLNRPELLILDEPTSGFDPLGRLMVRDLLTELKTAGVSILLSSHILSEVEQVALPYSVREQLHRLRDREWKLQNLRHRIGYIE
jgi:ABC-2 type transport system ATP-binding protein